jgi:two-component system, LytTR family, response regulator
MTAPQNTIRLNALLVDDELPNIENLSALIAAHCPWINVAGTARNIRSAVEFLQSNAVDVVFLDIEMPNGNGFELLPHIGKNTSVVFVTAHNRYALKALKASATDYLLKPIDIDELVETGNKLLAINDGTDPFSAQKEERYQALRGTMQHRQKVEKLILPHQRGFRVVNVSSIIYLEGDNSYTTVFTTNDAPAVVTRTLKDFEQMLEDDPDFFRIHKSYIVNLRHIHEFITEDGGYVILPGKQRLPVSRRRLGDFMRIMKQNGTNSR